MEPETSLVCLQEPVLSHTNPIHTSPTAILVLSAHLYICFQMTSV